MVRPALAVALAAALCAAAVAPPVGDQALSDDIAVGAAGACTDCAPPGLGHPAMIVPPRPVVPTVRVAIVTPWRDEAAPAAVALGDRLTLAPKTSPPS
ncbi:MAG: hypothetical protein K8W52_24735 [Deltaproteobacteria bacterium]|nr:hypothetical protein [Deltaproteobacteria bacterium]